MSRVKRGVMTKKRHKRVLKQTKGFWGQRKNVFRRAKETLLRAMAFAFAGRRLKKRSMRNLFVVRIKAAAEARGSKYNVFIHQLLVKHVGLNRKMLSQIAIFDAPVFDQIMQLAQR
jgi:large subunit ribosomal protein L20